MRIYNIEKKKQVTGQNFVWSSA